MWSIIHLETISFVNITTSDTSQNMLLGGFVERLSMATTLSIYVGITYDWGVWKPYISKDFAIWSPSLELVWMHKKTREYNIF